MRIDVYYDITCCRCGRSRSTDFEMGMATGKAYLSKAANQEGWKEEKTSRLPICPICLSNSTPPEDQIHGKV